jgi:predicted metal-dependent hydrolase
MTPADYTLKLSRRSRNIRISILKTGQVRVSAPLRSKPEVVHIFVQKHESWIQAKLREYEQKPKPLLASSTPAEYKNEKEIVKILVEQRLNALNSLYNFTWKSVTIRNQKSRWGSCTSRKVLNFNYLLGKLPEELRDYIIVHELCHLQEMNHGPRFWALVALTFPNYRELRKKLSTM